MRKRILLGAWVLACTVLFNPPLPAQTPPAEQDFQILYHEPLDLSETTVPTVSGDQAGPSLNLSFRAFDQVFILVLEPNAELTAHLSAEQRQQLAAKLQLFRGTITGITDSWVRLSRWNNSWSGVFWDGSELYLIDSSAELKPALQNKINAAATSGTIIYRLSDTLRKDHTDDVLAPDSSSSLLSPAAEETDFPLLVDHLQDLIGSGEANKQLELALVADSEFVQSYDFPEVQLLMQMNVVDGIFARQVGVHLKIASISLLDDNGPLVADNAAELMGEFAAYAGTTLSSTPSASWGLAHLFTHRELAGATGAAYLGALCNTRYGVSLSQTRGLSASAALVVAHEVAHNFGAPHDNQSGSPCASTPGDFLMNPTLNGSEQLSQCSIEQMVPVIAAAACITDIEVEGADLTLSGPADMPVAATVSEAFEVTVKVENIGNEAARNAGVTIVLPAELSLRQLPDNCSESAPGTLGCDPGELDAAASSVIALPLQGDQSGDFNISATVTADNDADAGNNSAVITVRLVDMSDAADVTVTVPVNPIEAGIGATFGLQTEVSNRGMLAAQESILTIGVPAGIEVETFDSELGSCIKQDSAVECQLGTLEAGAASKVGLMLKGSQAGDVTSMVSVAAASDDNTGNNSVAVLINLKADDGDDSGDDNGDSSSAAPIISLNSGKCLAAKNKNVKQYGCSDGEDQQWLLTAAGEAYQIQSLKTDLCLDANASARRGANVRLKTCDGSANQLWTVTEDGDAMLIKLAAGEQCLDVQGASRRNGANVLIWPCHGRANQRWRIPVNDTGEPPLTGIINGSFEEFVVSSDLRTWKLVRLDGWKALETRHIKETDKLSGIDVNSLKKEIDAEIWDAQTGLPASAGDYKVELDAHRKNIDALLQMFMVEAGKTYTLSFDAYGRKPESSDVEVWIDGYYVETISPVEQWQTYTYPVVEGETHSILLREVKQQSDGFGAVLDNVQLLSDDDREAPTVPQNLSATAIAGGVELAWEAASDNVAVAGYEVLRDGAVIATVPANSYSDTSVMAGTTYSYTVLAFDAGGNRSEASAAATATPLAGDDAQAPGVPMNLVATPTTVSIDLAWEASTDNVEVTGYEVLRDGEVLVIVQEPGYSDTEVEAETTYSYSVAAFDAAGNKSAAGTAVTAALLAPVLPPEAASLAGTCMACHGPGGVSDGPAIPTLAGMSSGYLLAAMEHFSNGERHATVMNRIVTGYSTGQLQMIAGYFAAQPFQAAAQDFAMERVERGMNLHLNECDICHSDSGRNPIDDKGLLAGQWMAYLRHTLDDFRAGRSQAPATMTDRIKAMSPEDLEDLVHYYGSFMTDSDAPQAPQNLTVTEVTATTVTLSWAAPADAVDVAGYQIYRDGQMTGETDLTTFAFTDDDLTPATRYVYTVVAVDGAGNASLPSAAVTATTDADNEPPQAPAAVTVDDVTKSSVTLSWQPAVDDGQVVAYEVYRDGTLAGTSAATAYTDTGLNPLTSYVYSVVAIDSMANRSEPSTAVTAMTNADTPVPEAPLDVIVSAVTAASVSLSWTAATEGAAAAKYEVNRDDVAVGETATTLFTDQGLAAETAYVYTVIAIDAEGNRSPASLPAAAMTESATPPEPSVERGRQLWQANTCEVCHGAASQFTAGADPGLLNNAINTNRGGMGRFSTLSGLDRADLAAYVTAAINGSDDSGGASEEIDGVELMTTQKALRKGAILLAGRLPQSTELEQAGDSDGLWQALRAMLAGQTDINPAQPGLSKFIFEAGVETFLSEGAAGLDEMTGVNQQDFPQLETLSNNERRDADYAARYEATMLMSYIVLNDLPWSEVLSADYTVVNQALAKATAAEPLEAFTDGGRNEFRPARIPQVSALLPDIAYPHAGVLTTNAWLSRFPTTATNRNRHRAKMLYLQFLATNLEALGQRPIDDSEVGDFLVPTMENPNCTQCHNTMEPIAGGFQNWSVNNRYWEFGGDSLPLVYKSADYYLNQAGERWYHVGDNWFRDMFEPGFSGLDMPGSYYGFNRDGSGVFELDQNGWSIHAVGSEDPGRNRSAANAIDGNPNTFWRTDQDVNTPLPQDIQIDMGETKTLYGFTYLPRQEGNSGRIENYAFYVSDDPGSWGPAVAGGTFAEPRDGDKKVVRFARAGGRYIRLVSSKEIDDRQAMSAAEISVIGEKPAEGPVPFSANQNGGNNALQWLAIEAVNDARFAKGAVHFWYRALFKRDPLTIPLDTDAPDYRDRLAAYQVQNAVFEKLAGRFAQDRGNGAFNVKDLLADLISDDLFRAEQLSEGAGALPEMSVAATARVLQPQELHQKTLATIGYDWRPFRDASYWTNELAFMYAGFDGGEMATTLNGSLSPLLTQIPDRMALEGVCEVVRNDFRRASDERRLFPTVSSGDIPSPNAGAVVRQLWTAVNGTGVSNLTADPRFPDQPDQVETLSSVAAAQFGDNYGQRLQAYVVAPASGDYTFWIAGDDNTELWLSSDSGEAGKQLIARVPGWTSVGEWTKYPEQRSATISLQAGQQYYLEVLHKEGGGGDHLAAAWEGPGLPMQVIAADHLAVFDPSLANLSEERIRANLQYLHWVLLGETLAADDPELDRSYQLFKAVWDARAEGDSSGVTCSLNDQNDANYAQRAWVAVLVYLMGDPHYLYE